MGVCILIGGRLNNRDEYIFFFILYVDMEGRVGSRKGGMGEMAGKKSPVDM